MRVLVAGLIALVVTGCAGDAGSSSADAAGPAELPAVTDARIVATGATDPALYGDVWSARAGDSLTAVTIAGATTSLHLMVHADGMMTMSPVDALPVPDSAPLSLRTGEAHGMVHKAGASLAPGDTVVAVFRLASGDSVRVIVPVVSIADAVGAR